MKIPKKIKVGPHVYKVVRKKKIIDENGDELRGECRAEERVILIQSGLKNTRLCETFLHEIVHAIDEENQMELGENRVNIIGLNLMQIIVDNKLDFLSLD